MIILRLVHHIVVCVGIQYDIIIMLHNGMLLCVCVLTIKRACIAKYIIVD
jgi:hypothetical protein